MIDGLSPSEHIAALLRTIEAHHGASTQDPPFSTLLVFGAHPDTAASAAIRALGGGEPTETADGFRVAFHRQAP
jgi:hypothetical protein